MKFSDQDLLKFFENPNTKELGMRHLMRQYKEKLYWQIKRIVTHHDDADEVLQNVWIKIWLNIDKFKAESAISTWLYRIAYNESISYIQNIKKQNLADWESVMPIIEGNTEEEIPQINGRDREEILQKIQEAIELLPEKQKLIFHMRYFEEMPYQQIADITGTSEGALKASFHHAVKKIEEKVKKY